MMSFLAGTRYVATACMDGGGRFVATCSGRANGAPTFSADFALAPERVMVVDGREIAFVRDARGLLFSMSAGVPLCDDEEARTGGRWIAALSRIARAARQFFYGRNGDARI